MDINESRVFTDFLLRNSDFDVERKRLVLNRKLDLFGLNIYIFLQTLLMYLLGLVHKQFQDLVAPLRVAAINRLDSQSN